MTEQVPSWMKRFLNQDLLEEREELQSPRKLLDQNGRTFIWWLGQEFSVTSDGVMGHACTLLERVMAKQFKMYSNLPRRNPEWHQIKENLTRQVPLLASVCIALTTKMMSTERQVNMKTIHLVMKRMHFDYTMSQINAAEQDVLSKLGFCLPMFTNVEMASIMAVDVGMTGTLLEAITLVTDVAEYFRAAIQRDLNLVAFSTRENDRLPRQGVKNIRHVHLVAGCVVATGLFLKFSNPNLLPRLCFLTQSSRAYLKCIGDLILNRLTIDRESSNTQPSRKRKMSD